MSVSIPIMPSSLAAQANPLASASVTTTGTPPAEVGALFRSTLRRAVDGVNDRVHSADAAARQMVASNGANLHETMIEIEKADLSVRLAVRIGQKLVQAYQEVSRMQV